ADAGEAGHGIDLVEIDTRLLAFARGLHQEVDAGEAGAVAGAEGGDGHGADLFGFGGGQAGGNDGDAGIFGRVSVLGVVVVELFVGDDLADDGGFRRVVTEDGYFEFARLDAGAADALLDDELAIKAGGEIHGGGEFSAVVNLGDADAGAEVCRLDEEGIFERL